SYTLAEAPGSLLGRHLLSLSLGTPTFSLSSLWHMVELRSGRRVVTEEIQSVSRALVDTSRGRTPERLEATAPPAQPPPRIREFRNPAKVLTLHRYDTALNWTTVEKRPPCSHLWE
ncbi:hypothetical protein Taro_028883, partial [Colocasia esculenta]|nr:hypothetical protein [Colocasia esculenta]